MKLSKRILKSAFVRNLLCWLGAFYIRFVHATSRWETVGEEYPRKQWDSGKPFIGCFWHGRILMMPKSWDYKASSIHMLISKHGDGEMISKVVSYFGINTTAGSTSRGGLGALREMMKILKGGGCVAFTPDGPRGPRMRASMGIVALAKMTGHPIIPVSHSVAAGKLAKSWDRFLIGRPFSRGVYVWGPPIMVPKKASEEELEIYRKKVEDGLNWCTAEADRLVGRETVEPASLNGEEGRR